MFLPLSRVGCYQVWMDFPLISPNVPSFLCHISFLLQIWQVQCMCTNLMCTYGTWTCMWFLPMVFSFISVNISFPVRRAHYDNENTGTRGKQSNYRHSLPLHCLLHVHVPYITVYKPHFFAAEKISSRGCGLYTVHQKKKKKKNFFFFLKFQFMPLHLALCLAMSPSSVIGVLTHHSETRTILKFVCHLGLKVIFLIDLNM